MYVDADYFLVIVMCSSQIVPILILFFDLLCYPKKIVMETSYLVCMYAHMAFLCADYLFSHPDV